MPFDDLYEKHGRRVGIEPWILKRFAQIENSERAHGCTGSYCGIMQLSRREFRDNGGTGSIFDPEQNIMAAANMLAKQKLRFREEFDRDPEPHEMYLMHNQGEAGARAHFANPDRLAQDSMYSTGEGRGKGYNWSGRAVALNTPGGTTQYGGLKNMTSRDFTDAWRAKFDGRGGMQSLAMQDQEIGGGGVSTSEPDEHTRWLQSQHGSTTPDELRDQGGPISRSASREESYGDSKPKRAGRGVADVEDEKKSLLNKDEEEIEFTPPKPTFQVPDLTVKFA